MRFDELTLDEFEFRPDLTTDYRVSCPWASEKIPIDLYWENSHQVFSAVFDRILFILAGNEDIHKSLYEFEFRTDPTTDYRVSCPWASKKSMSSHISVDIDPIFFKLAGNKNMHNIMNEFEFRPDRTTDYRVSCPWASKKYPHRLIMGKMMFPLFLCCFWLDPFDTFM